MVYLKRNSLLPETSSDICQNFNHITLKINFLQVFNFCETLMSCHFDYSMEKKETFTLSLWKTGSLNLSQYFDAICRNTNRTFKQTVKQRFSLQLWKPCFTVKSLTYFVNLILNSFEKLDVCSGFGKVLSLLWKETFSWGSLPRKWNLWWNFDKLTHRKMINSLFLIKIFFSPETLQKYVNSAKRNSAHLSLFHFSSFKIKLTDKNDVWTSQ